MKYDYYVSQNIRIHWEEKPKGRNSHIISKVYEKLFKLKTISQNMNNLIASLKPLPP